MIRIGFIYVAMFFGALLMALAIVWAVQEAVPVAYADTCIDQTTGQPCPPRGDRLGGSCMENPGGHLLSGVGDYAVMLLAPVVAIGALVVTERRHDDEDE